MLIVDFVGLRRSLRLCFAASVEDLDTHLPLGLFECGVCRERFRARVGELLSWDDDPGLRCCERLAFLVEILEPAED